MLSTLVTSFIKHYWKPRVIETKKKIVYVLTDLNILVKFSRNHRYWWVHPQCFKDDPFQVLHLKGVLEGGRAVRVSENGVDLIVNSRLGSELKVVRWEISKQY